jgi:hypothetical protein
VVVDDVASEAVERGERGDPREVGDHIGVGLHRLYRCKVAPLRVDDYMTLIRGGDEAGRDPAIEPADDTFSIVTQELDELRSVERTNEGLRTRPWLSRNRRILRCQKILRLASRWQLGFRNEAYRTIFDVWCGDPNRA